VSPSCSSSTTSLLSGKSWGSHSMPSSLYRAASFWKMNVLKYSWRSSLVKLMQSCSKELTAKNSNPNMSSTPQNVACSRWPMESFVRLTTCPKIDW